MNSYYFSSSATTNGDGSINSPFNSLDSISSITTPVNLYFKRGDIFDGELTVNIDYRLLGDGSTFIIGAYGRGENPVFRSKSGERFVHRINNAYNLQIRNLSFVQDIPRLTPVASRQILSIWLVSVNSESNVLMEDVHFHHRAPTGEDEGFMCRFYTKSSTTKTYYHNVKVKRCSFNKGVNGLQLIGNIYQNDPKNGDWETDHSRSKNWRVEDCAFVDITANACLLTCTDSETTDPSDSKYNETSGIFNCTSYSEHAGDYNASVPFWIWSCWRTVIDGCIVGGTINENTDHEGYDIDVGCSYCVIRNSIAFNCQNGFALIIGEYKEQADRYSGTPADPKAFFITQHGGNFNNVIENCIAYNCGVAKEIYNFNDQHVLVFTGVQSGTVVKNFTSIDTLSKVVSVTNDYGTVNTYSYTNNSTIVQAVDGFYSSLIASDIPAIATIKDSVFYFNEVNTKTIFYNASNNNGRCKISVSNSWFYSDYLGETGSSSLLPVPNSTNGITVSNLKTTNPLLNGLMFDSPKTFEDALRVSLAAQSPLKNAGSVSSPDLNGNLGNDVWWHQTK